MNTVDLESNETSASDFVLQSTPRHVAIIMDGNRRWALERGMEAASGHRAGVERLRELVPCFAETCVETLTVFAFSSANWQRNQAEVNDLLKLADRALRRFVPVCRQQGIGVEVIGRRDRLPWSLRRSIDVLSRQTRTGRRRLRIAFDYSSREAIELAARSSDSGGVDGISRRLGGGGDVDLLIRTGKEQRLSDFLLWECAFAELYFPDLYWPDFTSAALRDALDWFARRQRRFGA